MKNTKHDILCDNIDHENSKKRNDLWDWQSHRSSTCGILRLGNPTMRRRWDDPPVRAYVLRTYLLSILGSFVIGFGSEGFSIIGVIGKGYPHSMTEFMTDILCLTYCTNIYYICTGHFALFVFPSKTTNDFSSWHFVTVHLNTPFLLEFKIPQTAAVTLNCCELIVRSYSRNLLCTCTDHAT
jgi:hypothetical protein